MRNICIYHKGCMDGFGAAWVVNRYFQEKGGLVDFVPARYDDPPPDVSGANVIIVDFSYPRDVLEKMFDEVESLIVLDHHKTAKENLDGLVFARFDMDKAGCRLAWEYFYPDQRLPLFLEYIEDRDLWRFNLPESKAINAAMYSHKMDFDVWTAEFFSDVGVAVQRVLIDQGHAILRDRQKTIDSLASGWAVDRVTIAGYEVPILNCPRWLASDVLNILAQGEPFAVGYFDSVDKRQFELRSTNDGVDVSEVAQHYGGGGHRNAAGFTMDKPRVFGSTEPLF